MKKNVVFWVGVKNNQYAEKYGGWEWMDISRKTWEYWCYKNDVVFFPMEKPIEEDLTRFRINWQKSIYCFDLLEEAGIDYDQIFLVDATCMVKWDMPNIFELTDHKFTAWRETDNLNWVYESITGYNDFFGGFNFDKQKYFSSGILIFNEKHKEVFKSFKQLYYDNTDKFLELQDKIVRKGTEQTPLNYWLQINNVEMNLNLPFSYKLTHIHRKEMFKHSWQLNEDMTPFFIKYGYNWVFNGIPKNQRTEVMKQSWDLVKHNYDKNHILNKLVHKDTWCKTTSRKFKEDILRIFGGAKDLTCLEIGSCRGDTTRVFAECFKKVYSFERSDENIEYLKERCFDVDNVKYNSCDIYTSDFKIPYGIDVAFVDAGHSTELVSHDIKRLLESNPKMILIFDDYGQADGSIKNAITESNLPISRHIGEYNGFICTNLSGKEIKFIAREGVICNMD
tara:strand:- start:817 stop:2166 length:1350 start_codon:yes stop_codon:yes gene_type:complete